MKINLSFIPQNTAPLGARSIWLYDSNGNKLKNISLGNLASKSTGNKLYTFGALSDVHLPYNTGPEDFARALNYFNNTEKVNFICISGDMGSAGADAEWASFKNYVDTYSPNTTVHISAGNHDAGQSAHKTYEYPITYTGNPLYYSFAQGDDVFIMFGLTFWGNPPFSKESLQWLYETLEENRNKRCFVFQHMMRKGHAGDASGRYSWDGLNNTNGQVFLSLMEHYKNVLWFHGHSHCEFEQQDTLALPNSNYDRAFGCHSIHVPSCCMTRNESNSYDYEDSEGYVVDVYKNGIHLRGRDFVAEKFLPVASYWIDTKLAEIEEKTYSDSYGVIDTGSEEVEPDKIILPENTTYTLNVRESYTSKSTESAEGMLLCQIPCEPNTDYTLLINNKIPLNSPSMGSKYSTIFGYDENKTNAYIITGNVTIREITSEYITYANEKATAAITFTTTEDTHSIMLSLVVSDTGAITEDDIKGVVISLKPDGITLPEGATYTLNARDSYSGKATKDEAGMIRFYIPCEADTTYKLSVDNLPIDITSSTTTGNTGSLFCWDINKTNVSVIQDRETSSILDLISANLIAVTNNNKSFSMNLTTSANAGYIALSLVISTTEDITEDDIKDIVITLDNITIDKSKIYLNRRYSQSKGEMQELGGVISVNPSVEPSTTYKLTFRGSKTNIRTSHDSLYFVNSNGVATIVNGNSNISKWTEGAVYNEDYTGVEATFTTEADTVKIWFSILFNPSGTYIMNIDEITDVVLILEKINNSNDGITLPENTTYTLNVRDSYSSKTTKDEAGMIRFYIPYEADTTYKLNVENLPIGIYTQNAAGNTASLFCWDMNKTDVSYIQGGGSSSVRDLISAGLITVTNNDKSFSMNLTTSANAGYIALSLVISTTENITENDIKDIVITLNTPSVNIVPTLLDTDLTNVYNGIGYKENARVNSTGGVTDLETSYATTLTGLIPLEKDGDVLHVRGVDKVTYVDGRHVGWASLWDSTGTLLEYHILVPEAFVITDKNGDFAITIDYATLKVNEYPTASYIRLQVGGVTDELIITRNQLI